MTVFVDDSRLRFGRLVMCHMIADSLEELNTMAKALYLKPEWFQPLSFPHYDICQSKREEALRRGACVISRRDLVELIRRTRNEARRP